MCRGVGSHSLPWESYSNLPPSHPVFRYPAELREKLYAKGIGKLPPKAHLPCKHFADAAPAL